MRLIPPHLAPSATLSTLTALGTFAIASALSGCAADASPEASAAAPPAASTSMTAAAAPAPTGPTAPQAPTAPAPMAPDTAGTAAAPARLEAPEGETPPEVTGTEDLQQAGVAIEAALAAAAEVEGTDACDTAYTALGRMLTEMRRRMPQAVSERGLPPRDAFVGLCRELPPELQRCLQIGYAMQHQQECQAQRQNLDPAIAARLEAMMQSGNGGE